MVKDSGDVCDGNPSQTAFKWFQAFSFKQACPQHQKASGLESK